MKHMTSSEIRQLFLDFFQKKNHEIFKSASLVPKDDPTLLWINSGVATLKDYFDGTIVPQNPRIANVQKSIRTNDIENVGYTARHHTFFEMLGNFSIGDYFKKEAIEWAWEFLTSEEWLNFDENLLHITVHPEDDEAYDLWHKHIQIPEERILRLEENFWDIGVGPSGPNTEIFYDRGESFGNDPKDSELYPGGENDRYIEVWNLVFSQFNHNPDDTYTPLPNQNIDTGLGLERLVSIIQNTPTNFETDLFMPIIKKIANYASIDYGEKKEKDTAYKVIADHIRTVVFAVSDGALPSNEGRGYVLRRLLRRAVRFARILGINDLFMANLVQIVGEGMKDFYPEILEQQKFIEKIIKTEEERFHETLDEGLQVLSTLIEEAKKEKQKVIPGESVFKLYDTYGFPKELTEEYISEYGFTIDQSGFEKEMKKQQERARRAREQVESMNVQDDLLVDMKIESEFVGYHQLNVKSEIASIIKEHEFTNQIEAKEEGYVILNKTPFYAEGGGQVSDFGYLKTDQALAKVKDVQKAPNGQHIHQIMVESGSFQLNEKVTAIVDEKTRQGIIKNHTATHLLHQALQDVLGSHVSQAGSLVLKDRLRFDFNHFEAVTDKQLKQIEDLVNEKVWDNIPLTIENMPLNQAEEIGAKALFDEKYSDIVRVVQIGQYSIELCGGCHVQNTNEIGLFHIASESGIGAGTRRIEAVTSKEAYQLLQKKVTLLEEAATKLQTKSDNILQRIEQKNNEQADMKRLNESLQSQLAQIEVKSISQNANEIEGISLVNEQVSPMPMEQLRNMVDQLKQEMNSGVILLATIVDHKVLLAAGITEDLIEKDLHAGHLISEAASICGGGGGGRPDMAQAGGSKPEKIKDALQFAKEYIKKQKK